jgi:hypothetical protein
MSVIDEANLSRNVKRAFRKYFQNGMILGGFVAPNSDDTTFSDREQRVVEDMLRRNHRGVNNAHGWVISPKKFFMQQFDSKDTSKDIAILKDLRGSIMMAMGVPEELAGNPTDATYENLEATQYGWYRLKGIPYAKDVAEYHNNQIIPFIEPNSGIYLEPEISKYETERPEVVSQDVTASVISLYDAQTKRGIKQADDRLKDVYIVNGRPMHANVIAKLAMTMPANEIEQRANATEALASASEPDTPSAPDVPSEQPVQPEPEQQSESSFTPESEPVTEQKALTHEDAYSHDKALAELKAWKKFRKNDPSRNFETVYLRGDVADSIKSAIEADSDVDSAFDGAFDTVKAWQKAIQAVRIDFTDDFTELLERARDDSNNFGRRQWATAMRAIIRRYGTRAYQDGLVSGGVLDAELSEDDEIEIADLIAEHSQYVTNLGKEIFRTETGISDALANLKPEMWFRKTIMPFFDGGQVSANGNRMMEFTGDDGDESCPDCQRLKGQRHRHKTWKRKGLRPGIDTDNFDCGGFQCEHKLVPVSAKARGSF